MRERFKNQKRKGRGGKGGLERKRKRDEGKGRFSRQRKKGGEDICNHYREKEPKYSKGRRG